MKPTINKKRYWNEAGKEEYNELVADKSDPKNWKLVKTGKKINRYQELQDQAEANTLPQLLEMATTGQRTIETLNKEDGEIIDTRNLPKNQAQKEKYLQETFKKIEKTKKEIKLLKEIEKEIKNEQEIKNKQKTEENFKNQLKNEIKNQLKTKTEKGEKE